MTDKVTSRKGRSVIPFLIIAVAAVVFISLISYFTLLSSYYDTEEQYIQVVNDQAISEIESSLDFGKELENYYGIEEILNKSLNQFSEGSMIIIADMDGNGLYKTSDAAADNIYNSDYNTVQQVICDKDKHEAGRFITLYPKEEIKDRLSGVGAKTAAAACVLSLITIGCILVLSRRQTESKKAIIFIIILAMVLQGGFLLLSYQKIFKESVSQSAWGIGGYLALSLEEISEKNIAMGEISDLDGYLTSKESYDVIEKISLSDTAAEHSQDDYTLYIDIESSDSEICIHISKAYISRAILEMALTFVATIAVVFVIIWESIRLPELIAFRRSGEFNKAGPGQYRDMALILRYGNFLTSVGSYMCLAFAALMIREWNVGAFGLSPGVTAAASVSVCALAEAAGMLIAPVIGKKLKGKRLLLVSTGLLIFSNLACFFITSSAVILLLRLLAGLGFAGNKQATNIMIAMGYETHEERENNLKESNAGIIGGILCGSCLGAIIAGASGYAATFAGASLLFLLFAFFLVYFIPWKLVAENSAIRETEHVDFKRVLKLMTSPQIMHYSIVVNFPVYLYIMVIVTLIPAVIQNAGMPAVVLTYCNLLNGLAGLYVGVKLMDVLQKHLGRRKSLFVICISGAAAVFILSAQPVLIMVLISSIVTGLVDGAGTPLASDEFLELGCVKGSIDETTALALFSIIGFIVMTIAPIILETCVGNGSMMYILPAGMTVLALFLLIGNRKRGEKE